MSTYCDKRTKAVVKIEKEVVFTSRNPPISIEIETTASCSLSHVRYKYEYYHVQDWNQTWRTWNWGVDAYEPVNGIRLVNNSSGPGFKVQLFAAKMDSANRCTEPEWFTIDDQSKAPLVGRKAAITDIEQSQEVNQYTLKIFNSEGIEEFVKNYSEPPDYEVICGCDIDTELECKSDNDLGFCCISCHSLVSKLKAIENKFNF
jgi:hypothetical protein